MDKIVTFLQSQSGVITLAKYGNTQSSNKDMWSDDDLFLVVEDTSLSDFYPTLDWLRAIGNIIASEQHENTYTHTTRVCFEDFMCIDITIATESALKQIAQWTSVPFWNGITPVFSRSQDVSRLLEKSYPKSTPNPMSDMEFENMVNAFWFKSYIALKKIARNDLLIAMHLVLELIQESCVIEMMIRDKNAGTNIHKDGGEGNEFINNLQVLPRSLSKKDLVESVRKNCDLFDALCSQWSAKHIKKMPTFITIFERF